MKRTISITRGFITESLKRVPWVFLILVVLLIGQNIAASNARSANQGILLQKIASLSKDNKKLSQDNKDLSEQSVELANRSAKQVDCVKQLFVDYINTREYITTAEADSCTVIGTGFTSPSVQNKQATTNNQNTPKEPQPVTTPPKKSNFISDTVSNIFNFTGGLLNKIGL